MTADTIAAIATPPGFGGVGIVRLSGSLVRSIARHIVRKTPRPRYATYANFTDRHGAPIDQGICLFFPAPQSFTGEDILELQGHGGPMVLDLLLQRCLELGARLARPGEFSERAFLNGKIDLTQAEAIADLIESSTTLSAHLAIRSLQGEFAGRIHSAGEDLVRLRTYLEATLDFPEDEIDFQTKRQCQTDLHALYTKVLAILAEANRGERIREGLTVLIAGRPNAGKSSLLNALAQSDAAIVTPVPGTTRDLLRCDIALDGLPLRLIDSAGIHSTEDPVEIEGIRRACAQMEQADLILWVFDSHLGLASGELDGLPPQVPVTLVRNKVDLSPALVTSQPAPGNPDVIPISALTGRGLEVLRQHIRAKAGIDQLTGSNFIARRRHLDALQRALDAINNASEALASGMGTEIAAVDLVLAQQALGEITGQFTPEDLLDRIFKSFCIGK